MISFFLPVASTADLKFRSSQQFTTPARLTRFSYASGAISFKSSNRRTLKFALQAAGQNERHSGRRRRPGKCAHIPNNFRVRDILGKIDRADLIIKSIAASLVENLFFILPLCFGCRLKGDQVGG